LIDPTAIIDPSAEIGTDVTIGPWAWIGPGVEIGSGTHIGHHCVVKGPTTLGSNNRIFPFCSIGEDPQDKKFEPGGESRLEIGHGNTIREYCSINRGTAVGGGVTRLGNDNWLMSYCHIAHDCQVANHTVFANNAQTRGRKFFSNRQRYRSGRPAVCYRQGQHREAPYDQQRRPETA